MFTDICDDVCKSWINICILIGWLWCTWGWHSYRKLTESFRNCKWRKVNLEIYKASNDTPSLYIKLEWRLISGIKIIIIDWPTMEIETHKRRLRPELFISSKKGEARFEGQIWFATDGTWRKRKLNQTFPKKRFDVGKLSTQDGWKFL